MTRSWSGLLKSLVSILPIAGAASASVVAPVAMDAEVSAETSHQIAALTRVIVEDPSGVGAEDARRVLAALSAGQTGGLDALKFDPVVDDILQRNAGVGVPPCAPYCSS